MPLDTERNWWECPKASNQAFVAIIAKQPFDSMHYQIGIAEWGTGGYKETDRFFPTLDMAQAEATKMNENIGLDETDALIIKTSSMRAPGGRVRRHE